MKVNAETTQELIKYYEIGYEERQQSMKYIKEFCKKYMKDIERSNSQNHGWANLIIV